MKILYLLMIFTIISISQSNAQTFEEVRKTKDYDKFQNFVEPTSIEFGFDDDPFIAAKKAANTKQESKEITPLTIKNVEEMYKKNKNLTWKDFDGYKSEPVDPDERKYNKFVTKTYILDNGNHLVIGGPNMQILPRFIIVTDGNANILKTIKNDEY